MNDSLINLYRISFLTHSEIVWNEIKALGKLMLLPFGRTWCLQGCSSYCRLMARSEMGAGNLSSSFWHFHMLWLIKHFCLHKQDFSLSESRRNLKKRILSQINCLLPRGKGSSKFAEKPSLGFGKFKGRESQSGDYWRRKGRQVWMEGQERKWFVILIEILYCESLNIIPIHVLALVSNVH